jgi:UDP-N-acetylglucosamine--N-acetylmuramyl-(pentapeptide) pyrophosphoryl-undecaprenol N-acetylglucosamine transferase
MEDSILPPLHSPGVLIACGGTGGHFFPGIAVGEVLMRRGHEVIFVISEKEIDAIAAAAYPGYRFETIPSFAMPKPWSPQMIPFLLAFFRAVGLCKKWIREIGAKAVMGMGGFTSTAPLVAARSTGCASFIHESNAIPGRANLLNAKFADFALVGWEACQSHFPTGKTKVVGTPVRPSVASGEHPPQARAYFLLDPNRFTVMVMGGSQGAKGINDTVIGMLEHFDAELVQFLHLAGPGNAESVRDAYDQAGIQAYVAEFCSDMGKVYAASDLGICRSGASSLNEMAVAGLPGILIPYPHAADDHQSRNAEVFTASGACLMRSQADLNSLDLAHLVAELGTNPERMQEMRDAMLALAPSRSALTIGDLIEEASLDKAAGKGRK